MSRDYVLLDKLFTSVLHPDINKESKLVGVQGQALYYHYGCDGIDDRGWGCGYRSMQTLSSWVCNLRSDDVPSLLKIQEVLVKIGDKQSSFKGSQQWIGSTEIAFCLDELYQVPCKILHISSGAELSNYVETLVTHFQNIGSPIMMGGDSDNSSKAIFGIAETNNNNYFLVVDPHYYGTVTGINNLVHTEWISWRPLEKFDQNSFYNLCLPQSKKVEVK